MRAMSSTVPLYRVSWVDRLIDRIDALPGPPWVTYAMVAAAVALAVNAAAWVDGLVTPGTFDLFLSSLGVYVVLSVAAIHMLDARADRAWQAFRPAASPADEDAARVGFELTAMPAGPAAGWTIGGAAVGIVTLVAGNGGPLDMESAPMTLLVAAPVGVFAYASLGLLIYHTIRQLRLIGRLPRYIDRIELLDAGPLHAFSSVTALTGGLFLVAAYFSVLTDPTTFTNPAVAAVNGFIVLLGVACFVLPLYAMHERIAAEKDRRMSAVSQRLDTALRDLARRNETGDLTDADAVNKNISSLLAERDVLARTPTWPWPPETLRGFSTALALPIILWLIFRVLEVVLA
jgi:hypothetical protein